MENTNVQKKKFSDKAGAAYAMTALLMLVGQFLGLLLEFIPILSKGKIAYTGLLYLEFIGIWLVVLLYLWFTKKNRPILRVLWEEPQGNTVRYLLLGLVAGFALNGVCILAAWLNGDIHLRFVAFQPLGMLYVFVAIFIQSSAEELLCRGFLYQRLLKVYRNPVAAIVGNSLFFAVLHLFNNGVTVLSLINIFAVGVLFSMMVYYMDSLWCAMAVHTAWNYTQNILFGLPNSGIVVPFSMMKLDAATARNSFAYNVGFGVEGTLFADFVLIAACVVLYLWGRKRGANPINIWKKDDAEYV